MRKRIAVLCLLLLFALTGCNEIGPDNPKDGKYATQNRESTLEYSIYMNKQIQVFLNEINTRMTIARNIVLNRKVDNEASLAESSLEKMQKVYDEASLVNPSIGAEKDREDTLKAMQTAMEHMRGYKVAVESGKDVEGYIADFENDFNQLTGLANLYGQ